MLLFQDLSNSFKITGRLFRPDVNEDKIYFDEITITLVNNNSLTFDNFGWRKG